MRTPATIDELKQTVIELRCVRVRGGGTKPAMTRVATGAGSSEASLSTARLSRVLAYDPGEFTFTALAGTPLREIRDMLAERGQMLAFDPPLLEAGATLGGAVAAGLSGPGRLRFGGLRDFLLGCRLVTGEGRIVFGGGKVVKNAAGFDIPKLMVGAQGAYGVLAELTFKVFPRPESYASLEIQCRSLADAIKLQAAIAASPLEPACLDLLPPARLLVRVGGLDAALSARLERLKQLCADVDGVNEKRDDESIWHEARELTWCKDDAFVARAAITPNAIEQCESALESAGCKRRYSVAGNCVWLAAPKRLSLDETEHLQSSLGASLTVLRGIPTDATDAAPGDGFRRRLRSVFDPQGKFVLAGSQTTGP